MQMRFSNSSFFALQIFHIHNKTHHYEEPDPLKYRHIVAEEENWNDKPNQKHQGVNKYDNNNQISKFSS